jgi:4-hydroxyphenylpyruvate dioxygenase
VEAPLLGWWLRRHDTVMVSVPTGRQSRHSIATVCLSGTLEDRLAAAAKAGFQGVEIFENDLIASPLSLAQIRSRAEDLGLAIELYQPFRDAEGAPPERFAATLRRMRAKLDLMAVLAAPMILICSSVAPDTIDDDGLAADQLRQLADLADERGILIAYEALAWGRHVSTWEHSWQLVRRADHPALGLCLDSFHVLSKTDDYKEIESVPGDRVFFLQLADAPRLAMDVLQWSRHHRLFPLQGGLDLVGFTRAVLASGYQGPLSLEVFNDVFRQADPTSTAVDAMRSLIALQDASVPGGGGLVAAPSLSGIAFAELGVDGESGPELETMLRALGFAHTGQHRSKPVQLWEQGTARILLNVGAVQAEQRPGSAAIRAFALESADPARSGRRAEQLLARPLPRRRRQTEADLTAVAAPDGTEVFFCRTGPAGQHDWLDDFLPTGERGSADAGITSIDHLSLAQPFDRFDEAALFYRTVLGLEYDEAAEFAAPFGLIRTVVIRDPDRRVRIALSVPLLRRGEWAPGVADPQHITLATDDIERTARALARAGAQLLSIPRNYHDDLDARLDLEPRLSAMLREIGGMYDEDRYGRYVQLFTPVLGSRVFFEISQRLSGYRAYGLVNDPVRMAAHRARRVRARATR